MSLCGDNLVGLSWNRGFETGVIFQGYQKGVTKGIVFMWIPRIGRVRIIWHKVLLKLGVYFDGLVSRKDAF